MTTLAGVVSAMLPGARMVSAADADSRPVTWVRVMRARAPAFDALEPGDLAIVRAAALAVIAPGREEVRALADACATANVAGLLLIDREGGEGTGARPAPAPARESGAFGHSPSDSTRASVPEPGTSDVLDQLAADLEALGVPAARVPSADLAALERGLIGFLVTQGAELDRQASLLEARLEQLALAGGGPVAMLGAVATFLGRSVALEDRRGNAVAVHAPPEIADGPSAVARYHARPRHAVALRLPLPTAGGATGSLALLGERPVGELERVSVARIAGLLALELAREEAVRRAQDQTRRAETLPPAGPPWAVLIARQRLPGGDDDAPGAREHRENVRRDLRLLAPAKRLALRGDADSLEIRAVLAIDGGGQDPAALSVAKRMADFLGRTVSVSQPFLTAVERPTAEGAARTTLQAAEALAEPPAVAQATRLPAYRLVGALHNLPDGERLAAELLAPLLASRPSVRREHLATLRALLDHGGVNETAAALGVHRNTVAYRLRRIEAITGWHLADPELRLPLAVAIRLVQND